MIRRRPAGGTTKGLPCSKAALHGQPYNWVTPQPPERSVPMKILLAVDGSEYTRRAAQHLVSHLHWFAQKPSVFLLTVHAPIPLDRAAAVVGRGAVEAYQRDECLQVLRVAEDVLKAGGVAYTSAWVAGEVAPEVAAFAQAQGIELIVMGSHGHGALAGLALGANVTKVIASTKVPVLIVR